MGASVFSGLFDRSSEYFDGEGRVTRDNWTVDAPSLWALLKQAAYGAHRWVKSAADAAAGTTTAEFPFATVDTYIKSVQKVQFTPAANMVASDTVYATLQVGWRNPGGSLNVIANATTALTVGNFTGNWTAWTPVIIPLYNGTNLTEIDDPSLDIPAGAMLTVSIAKASTGTAVPAGVLEVFYK
jgi:hypothetical protein